MSLTNDLRTANCDANPGFKPVASGGNGDSVQYCEYHRVKRSVEM